MRIQKYIVVERGKSLYSYWRDVKNINKIDMFQVDMEDEVLVISAGKVLDTWCECVDEMEALLTSKRRDIKLRSILNESE